MTPMELELLKTAWPWIWSGRLVLCSTLLAGAWMYLKSLNSKLEGICKALSGFSNDVTRIEKEMIENRSETRHRLDRLIGESDARISRIEAVCATQHGINMGSMNRRSTDTHTVNWAQDSDIRGNAKGA